MKAQAFLGRVREILGMIGNEIRLLTSDMSSIGTDGNGNVNGMLYNIEAFAGKYRTKLDYQTLLNVIAFVLCEAGVPVYNFRDHLIVAQRTSQKRAILHALYSRGDFFGNPEENREASIFADDMGALLSLVSGQFIWDGEKVVYQPWHQEESTVSEDVQSFSMTLEEIIRKGNETDEKYFYCCFGML